MLIYLNKYSNNGRGYTRWLEIRAEFENNGGRRNYNLITNRTVLHQKIIDEYNNGERVFIAAGGDGTVNLLLNEIMQLDDSIYENIILGAIGLGSSNDFHKPFTEISRFSSGIPYKLDFINNFKHNTARVIYIDNDGSEQVRYFIINSSIGIVAEANNIFNNNDRIIKYLKPKCVGCAILYSGIKSIIGYKNVQCNIRINGEEIDTDLSNLGLLIKPNFSGNFCYDMDVGPISGHMGVALCENMGVYPRFRTICSLAKGRFYGLSKTRVWKTGSVEIKPARLIPLELDGEVVYARSVKVKLIKGGIRVCR